MKIAVIVPCYNEEVTIGKVVTDFKRYLPEADVYVYDNNSKDKTVEVATEAGAIIGYEHKQGKGNVMRAMFKDVDADCYIMVDGDDTYPAYEVQKLVDEFSKGYDMVIGDRLSSTYFKENKRPFHSFGNVIVRLMINILFGSNIRDVMTGYRALSKNLVKNFPCDSNGFCIETEMTIWSIKHKMKISNVVIDYKDRPEGSYSKLNTVKDGINVVLLIIKLFFKYLGK